MTQHGAHCTHVDPRIICTAVISHYTQCTLLNTVHTALTLIHASSAQQSSVITHCAHCSTQCTLHSLRSAHHLHSSHQSLHTVHTAQHSAHCNHVDPRIICTAVISHYTQCTLLNTVHTALLQVTHLTCIQLHTAD